MKYRVTLHKMVPAMCVVDVDAEDEQDACDMAEEIVWDNPNVTWECDSDDDSPIHGAHVEPLVPCTEHEREDCPVCERCPCTDDECTHHSHGG